MGSSADVPTQEKIELGTRRRRVVCVVRILSDDNRQFSPVQQPFYQISASSLNTKYASVEFTFSFDCTTCCCRMMRRPTIKKDLV